MTTKTKSAKSTKTTAKPSKPSAGKPAPKAKPSTRASKPGTSAPPAGKPPYPGFEAYDVVQISTDDGATWSEFDSIRTVAEALKALAMTEETGPRLYRIISGDKLAVRVASAGVRATQVDAPATAATTSPEVATTPAEPQPTPPESDKPTKAATKAPRSKPAKAEGKLSMLDAAAQVLAGSGTAMNSQELITAMREQGLWTSPGGKTPQATLHAAMSSEIKKRGDVARFAKAERGKFTLRQPAPAATS